MKKILMVLGLGILLSCTNGKNKDDVLRGRIIGLKKGTVYLNKIEHGKPVPVDSLRIKGTDEFEFDLSGYEPQLMAITLKENKKGDYVLFFADDTVNTVKTSLRKFGIEKTATGGENFRKWTAFKEMMSQYHDRKLDLIKEKFQASKNRDTAGLNEIEKELQSLEKRRLLYALNFSFTNKDLPVGAYVAYTQLRQSRPLLDTVFKAMNNDIKQSYYGKQIGAVLDSLK